MATLRDTSGAVIGYAEAGRFRDVYGNWVYSLICGGSVSGDRILDSAGNWVAEIRNGRVYDTAGNWLGEFVRNRFVDAGGNWIFTVD